MRTAALDTGSGRFAGNGCSPMSEIPAGWGLAHRLMGAWGVEGSAVAEALAEVVEALLLVAGERVHAVGADLVEQRVELDLVGG